MNFYKYFPCFICIHGYFTCKDTFTIFDDFQCDPSFTDTIMWRFNYIDDLSLTISYRNWTTSSKIIWDNTLEKYLLEDGAGLKPIAGVSDRKRDLINIFSYRRASTRALWRRPGMTGPYGT